MEQTREVITTNLAERLCWQVARRDDSRVARRLYRKQVVDGVYPLDAGALLDAFLYFLRELGVVALLEDVRGKGIEREMVPMVRYVLLYELKTLFGIERMNALPELLFSDEASMRLVGFNAPQVRHGVCVAVGTSVTRRPPLRSRRAVFPHRALHRYSLPQSAKSQEECLLARRGVCDPRSFNPIALQEGLEALPGVAALLTPPIEPFP